MEMDLTSLPTELVHMVASYLPVSSLIALKLSSKRLFCATKAPPQGWIKTASSCERKAARRYQNERKDRQNHRRQCTTCNLVAPDNRFPIEAPICKWHDHWFLSTSIPVHVENNLKARLVRLGRRSKTARWIAVDRTYCAHTGDIVGWHVVDCECNCDSCGHFPVKCYIRITGSLGNPKFAELAENKLSVSEERWLHVPGQPLRIYQDSAPVVLLEDT